MNRRGKEQGTALLAVLWLTAALSMIAFSIADTVRSEIERSIAQQESLRAYYLARGAVEETLFRIRTVGASGITLDQYLASNRRRLVRFPGGEAIVEIASEQGKLNLRNVQAALLQRILTALGESPAVIDSISDAYSGARTPQIMNAGLLSGSFSSPQSTFSTSSASLENVEDLMLLPGVSSETMYGRFRRDANGRLVRWGGLADCLSPLARQGQGIDAWSVDPTLLVALGLDPQSAQLFVEARALPIEQAAGAMLQILGVGGTGLGLSFNAPATSFQIRATARPRLANALLSDTRRTVSLLVEYSPPPPQFFWRESLNYLRWFDQAESTVGAMAAAWLPVEAPALPVVGAAP